MRTTVELSDEIRAKLLELAARRGEPGFSADRIRLELDRGSLATTAITAFELRSGARSSRAAGQVEKLLAALPILPFDDEAAQ